MIKKLLLLTTFALFSVFYSRATVYTVSNLLDNNTSTGANQGDLRWCINQVIATAATGPHTINFNVAGTINAGSGYPALNLIAGGVTINGFTAPSWVSDPIIEIRGPGYGTAFSITNSPGSLLQGIIVRGNFGDPYINIDNSANTIVRGCWVGIDLTGNAGFGTAYANAILINNSANCQVGGNLVANPSYKVVVATMGGAVKLTGTSTGGTIRGVYSGINAAGTTALANGNNSHIDVGVGCNNTTIGGATTGDGCVLARTMGGSGIVLQSNNNTVKGNYVGTNAAGTAAMAIQNHGLYIKATSYNTIGGTTTAERNIFSSAGQYGILIESNSPTIARFNVFYNNLIGTTVTGNAALPNSSTNVRVKNGKNNKIGGTAAGQGNVISASANDCGVYFESECDSNLVAGNMIGLGLNGTTVLVNGNDAADHGIYCNGANSDRNSYKNNVIVTPSRGSGIKLDYGGYDTISANYIGTTANGLTVVGVGTDLTTHCIGIQNGISNMIITNNVLSCAKGSGIRADGDCSNYIIQGNIVGMNASGLGTTFGNNGTGIYFSNGTSKSNILIGGTTAAQRNIVSKNGMTVLYSCVSTDGYGIILEKTVGATISGNYVGVDATGIVAAGNGGSGIMLNQGCNNIIIGGLTAGERNVICDNGKYCSGTPANVRHGIQFNQNSPASPNFQVIGNYVGIGADGTTMLGNSEEGVSTYNTSGITIGGATAAHRNVIAGNNKGVFLQANAGNNNKVLGNYIGTDASGTVAKPNNVGVHIANGSSGNVVGGPNAGEGNVISGNTSEGILLEYATNTTIQQNKIGTTVGLMPLGNGSNGIRIKQAGTNGSTVNLIGSPTNTSLGNVIAFNTTNGILVEDANSQRNQIRRNSIYCNGSARQNGINLNGLGNINISPPGPLVVPAYISAATGILVSNTPVGDIAGTDVVEVFYDDACGTCQGKTYLGNATNTGTQWSFGPLPAASDCSPKGGPGCASGVKNITATRTDANGNTSEFMDCDPLYLPVSLLYFKGTKYGEQAALLSWATSAEVNNAYFELLRSTDGKNFQPITRVQGAGNSNGLKSYSFADENLPAGVYYYMLVQVDFDGTQTLSPIITINTDAAGTVEVVPNAVLAGDAIKVLNYTGTTLSSVALTDMTGKVLWETKAVTELESSVATTGLAPGIYLVKINTSVDQIVKKILVY